MPQTGNRFRWIALGALAGTMASAAAAVAATPAASVAGSSTTEIGRKAGLSDYLGLNYFTFFDGPGLGTEFTKSPSVLGRPSDDGWSLWTNLSVKGKVSSNLGVDLQLRLQQILTNDLQFRYQGARLGTSGTLLRLERPGYKLVWSGALNSDIPGAGQMNTERKLIVNPGLFSNIVVRPTGSRFSLFALVAPRVWFYSDADAMDRQSLQAGFAPGAEATGCHQHAAVDQL